MKNRFPDSVATACESDQTSSIHKTGIVMIKWCWRQLYSLFEICYDCRLKTKDAAVVVELSCDSG